MKKMTKKRDLGTLNEETKPKNKIYLKNEQDRPCWKFFTLVKKSTQKVNIQQC